MNSLHSASIPFLSTANMIDVDRMMIDTYQISVIQMMENAGRSLAHLARKRFLGGDAADKRVVILAGGGRNGGGALVAARRLAIWGAETNIILGRPENRMSEAARSQLDTLAQMNIEPVRLKALADQRPDLILDGLVGYNLAGCLRNDVVQLVRWANESQAPTLSLDVPTGVSADDGSVNLPAITADATLTLALPKNGLRISQTMTHIGELYLADIGVPSALYELLLGLPDVGEIFSENDIVQIW